MPSLPEADKERIRSVYARHLADGLLDKVTGKPSAAAIGRELGFYRDTVRKVLAETPNLPVVEVEPVAAPASLPTSPFGTPEYWQEVIAMAEEKKALAEKPKVVVPEPPTLQDAPEADPRIVRQLKRDLDSAKKDRDALLKLQEENERMMQMFSFIKEAKLEIPEWTRKAPSQGNKRQSIATAFFSDWHFDEVVSAAQVNFVNEFDRPIAEKRLSNFFNHTVELANDYLQGLKYEGLVLPLGGDTFSGIIHEELVETNAATIFESMLYWAEPMCAGIKMLRDAFGRVFLPAVPGNHGRYHRKPRTKNRPQDNFDWFFAHLLKRLLADEKGITFAVSDAADITYNIFDTTYLLTHGDQFRGGGGIAGLLSPLMIGDARKRKREAAVNRSYRYMICGHWHQRSSFKGVMINGSGKGYDEYAMISNFEYEPPVQSFWITDPVRGVTIEAPIHLQDESERYVGGSLKDSNGKGESRASVFLD